MAAIQPQGMSSGNEKSSVDNHEAPKAMTIAILGQQRARKTAWLQKFKDAAPKDNAITGESYYPIDFMSSLGPTRCNAIEIPFCLPQKELEAMLYSVDGIIFLFDLQSSDLAFKDIRAKLTIIKKIKNMGDKPMLLCGNKADLPAVRRVSAIAAAQFAKKAELHYYYEISTFANQNIFEPFECVAKLVEYRRTARHLQVITVPRLTHQQRIIEHLDELIENKRTIASIITPADNVVEEHGDHSLSLTQRFIQRKRDCMSNFVGEDDEGEEED